MQKRRKQHRRPGHRTMTLRRHGWSSAADAVGASEAMRMKHLGHTSTAVNRNYTDVIRAQERTVQDNLAELLFGEAQLV